MTLAVITASLAGMTAGLAHFVRLGPSFRERPKPVEPAFFWQRAAAAMIDGLLLVAAAWGVGAGLAWSLAAWFPSAMAGATRFVVYGGVAFMLACAYFSLMESSKRRATLGKVLLGLQVAGPGDYRICFWRGLLRFVGRLASIATLGGGFLLALLTDRGRALHDFIGATRVVRITD